MSIMEQPTGTLCAILVKCVVLILIYRISPKSCNTGSGYKPTLWALKCTANYNFPEVFGASLVFVAHCSEQVQPLKHHYGNINI